MLYSSKIRKLCSDRKTTLKGLAMQIGISEQGIHSMLRDDTMQVRTLQTIADYFKVPITWFFEDGNDTAPHIDVDRVFDVMKEIVKEKMK